MLRLGLWFWLATTTTTNKALLEYFWNGVEREKNPPKSKNEKIEYSVFIIHKFDEVLLLINGTSAVFFFVVSLNSFWKRIFILNIKQVLIFLPCGDVCNLHISLGKRKNILYERREIGYQKEVCRSSRDEVREGDKKLSSH